MHRIANSRDRQCAEIAIIKQATKQAARVVCDDNRVRFGKPLKPCREIRGLTNDRLFLGGALTKQITDDYEARGDTDAHLQRVRLARIELGHAFDQGEACTRRLFGVLLMRLRVTEISQHAVTEILGNKAAGAGDYLGATAVIGADDVAQLPGSSRADNAVEPTRSANMTVSWRRSASGALPPERSSSTDCSAVSRSVSARNAAIASTRIRRWPTAVTPRSLRSSAVSLGRTASSIAFSRNACS